MKGVRRAGVLAALIALVVACGGGGSSSGSTSSAAPTSTAAVTTTPQASTTSAPPGDDAALAAIRQAFETFFDGAGSTVDEKVAVLQDGERYRSMLVDASENAQFQSLTIDIREIRLVPGDECISLNAVAPCASVTHDLLVGGAPMLVARESAAVEVDGQWLVAASAWCGVVALGGENCP